MRNPSAMGQWKTLHISTRIGARARLSRTPTMTLPRKLIGTKPPSTLSGKIGFSAYIGPNASHDRSTMSSLSTSMISYGSTSTGGNRPICDIQATNLVARKLTSCIGRGRDYSDHQNPHFRAFDGSKTRMGWWRCTAPTLDATSSLLSNGRRPPIRARIPLPGPSP